MLFGKFVADVEQVRDLRGDVLSALGYFANWHFVFEHQSYAEIFNGLPSPVLHFWSLAIEEQFYLVFPLLAALLLWAGRGHRRVMGITLGVLAVGSVLLNRALVGSHPDLTRLYYGTDTRASELLVGALLAIVLVGRRRPARGPTWVMIGVVGTTSFVTLVMLWSTTTQDSHWLYEGGFALHALLMAAVLAESLLPGPLSKALAVPPLRSLGRISYGVYLYHWPVFLWLSPERMHALSDPQVFLLRVVVTLTAATVSFFLIERPVRIARGMHRWWPRVVAPVALAAIVFGVIAVRPSTAPPKIVFAPIAKGPPPHVDGAEANKPGAPVSRITAPLVNQRSAPAQSITKAVAVANRRMLHRPFTPDRPIRVMVVGDSVGQTFGRGLELWGLHTGRAQVWNDAHFYCALGRFAPSTYGTGVEHQGETCDSWGTRWPQEITAFDPDVVVVLYTFWEMVGRKPDGVHDFVSPGDPAYDAWQLSEYTTAVDTLSARGQKSSG